jgi:hypothetical protein
VPPRHGRYLTICDWQTSSVPVAPTVRATPLAGWNEGRRKARSDTAGVLSAAAFAVGAGPHDTYDRIVYNPNTGYLTYDLDGSGPLLGIEFGKVAPHLHLSRFDFVIGA